MFFSLVFLPFVSACWRLRNPPDLAVKKSGETPQDAKQRTSEKKTYFNTFQHSLCSKTIAWKAEDYWTPGPPTR